MTYRTVTSSAPQLPLVVHAWCSVWTVAAASSTPTNSPNVVVSPTTEGNDVRSTSAETTARTEAHAHRPLQVGVGHDRSMWKQLLQCDMSHRHFCSPAGTPTCRCLTGFTGPNCNLHTCKNYCKNGGNCTVSAGNQPSCQCPAEFLGEKCQYSECHVRIRWIQKLQYIMSAGSFPFLASRWY